MTEDSLYQRIGGKPALEAAVDRFYERVLADDRIAHFFTTVDMKGQRNKQKRFLAVVFGANEEWEGKDMRAAHAHLTLTEEHFTAVAENLQGALEDLGVDAAAIAEVMAIAASTHDDVLNL
jgi:hemoglobin